MSMRLFQTPSALVNVMGKAALRAAQGLVRDFGEVENLQVSLKGPRDFVSVADQKSERTIQKELGKARPRFGFLMEESDPIVGEEDMTWVVDPLDGTSNFLHGIPHFSISIGLLKGAEPLAGVIYDPIKDEMFWAEKSFGAFLNGHRLRVSSRKKLGDSTVGLSHLRLSAAQQENTSEALDEHTTVRLFGSAALDLAYVASGRLDGFVGRCLKPWDLLAGLVLVKEAGGSVTDFAHGDKVIDGGEILASNGLMHSQLRSFLKTLDS